MATEFICTINKTGQDYDTITLWEAAIQANFTSAATKVIAGSLTRGAIADAVAVTQTTSGATGVCAHHTATQMMLTSITGTPDNSHTWYPTANGNDTTNAWTPTDAGDSVIAVAECHKDDHSGIITDQPDINGSTTDATNYLKITVHVDDRHTGTASSGCRVNLAGTLWGFGVGDDYVQVEWLELKNWGANGYHRTALGLGNAGCVASNLIIHDQVTGNTGCAVSLTLTSKLMNCFIWDDEGEANGLVRTSKNATAEVYNCTVYASGSGMDCYSNYGEYLNVSTLKLVNCIGISESGTCFNDHAYGSWTAGSNYNLSSDTTAPGANAVKSVNIDAQFVTKGTDHHLVVGSGAIDTGTDLVDTPANVKYDIDNRDRDAEGDTWDIGADEYVATEVTTLTLSAMIVEG